MGRCIQGRLWWAEGSNTPVTSVMEGVLTDFVEQSCLNTIWCSGRYATPVELLHGRPDEIHGRHWVHYYTIPAFFRNLVDRIVEVVGFQKSVGHQLSKQGIVQISPPSSIWVPSKFELPIPTPAEKPIPIGSDLKKDKIGQEGRQKS